MPDSEQKKRSSKTIIPIPKSDERASDDVQRDESTQYGDDAEIRLPRRKRTDARIPIIKKVESEEAQQEVEDKPRKEKKRKKRTVKKLTPPSPKSRRKKRENRAGSIKGAERCLS